MFLFRPMFSDREESRGEESGTFPAQMSESFVYVTQNSKSEQELDAEYHFVCREDLDEDSDVWAESQEPGSEEPGAPWVQRDEDSLVSRGIAALKLSEPTLSRHDGAMPSTPPQPMSKNQALLYGPSQTAAYSQEKKAPHCRTMARPIWRISANGDFAQQEASRAQPLPVQHSSITQDAPSSNTSAVDSPMSKRSVPRGGGQFSRPPKLPPSVEVQKIPIRISTFGPNPPFPNTTSSIAQRTSPKAPAQSATVRNSNQYAVPPIPSYNALPRAIQSNRAAHNRRQPNPSRLAYKGGRRFSPLDDVAQDMNPAKPPTGPQYTNSVFGGKLKGRAGPVRQPTLPPDAGELKKGVRGNFERKRKSGGA